MKRTNFRYLTIFAAGLAALVLCGGCRSHVEVNGRSCAMLTEREVGELVVFARATLAKNSPSHVSAAELEDIRHTEPEVKIRYYGNCIGEAVVAWDLKNRKIEIVYDGLLTSTDPAERDMILRVMEKQTEILDFRPGRRQVRQEQRRPRQTEQPRRVRRIRRP